MCRRCPNKQIFVVDWRNAPDWATHAAIDESGEWYWYSSEPTRVDDPAYFSGSPGIWSIDGWYRVRYGGSIEGMTREMYLHPWAVIARR